MRKTFFKKLTALVLASMLACSLIPLAAFAEEGDTSENISTYANTAETINLTNTDASFAAAAARHGFTDTAYPEVTSLTITGAMSAGWSQADGTSLKTIFPSVSTLDLGGYTGIFSINAFERNTALTTVKLPSGAALSLYMFNICSNLTTVYTGDTPTPNVCDLTGINLANSGQCAFRYSGVSAVKLPVDTTLPTATFQSCSNLTTVYTGDTPSTGLCDLSKIDMTHSGGNVFEGTKMAAVKLAPDAMLPLETFKFCAELTTVYTGDTPIPNVCDLSDLEFTVMGSGVFESSGVTTVKLPSGAVLPGRIFYKCANLTTVYTGNSPIPNVCDLSDLEFTGMGGGVFVASGVATVKLPSGTVLPGSTFANCANLTTVYTGDTPIPNVCDLSDLEFTGMGSGVFESSGVTTVKLPSGTALPNLTFEGCASLSSLICLGDAPTVGTDVFSNVPSTGTVCYPEGTAGYVQGGAFTGTPIDSWTFTPCITPAISTHPTSLTRTVGESASFSVEATGDPAPTYQWQVSTDSGNSWNSIGNDDIYSGATTASLSLSIVSLTDNENLYRCLISNLMQSNVASNEAELTVEPSYTYDTLTDVATGVSVSGWFAPGVDLTVTPNNLHAEGSCAACDEIRANGKYLLLYDISLAGDYKDTLELSIPVPSSYNGKEMTVWHCKDATTEKVTLTAQEGFVKGTFKSLSPFAVFASASEATDNPAAKPNNTIPKTGDTHTPLLLLGGMLLSASLLVGLTALRVSRKRRAQK